MVVVVALSQAVLAGAAAPAVPIVPMMPAALDPSFGQDGVVVVQPNTSCAHGCGEFFGSHAEAVGLAPNGAVILAGNGAGAGPGANGSWLSRLEQNGALDPSFGAGGYAESQTGLDISQVSVDARERTLVLLNAQSDIALERYTPYGMLDSSFGHKGLQWLAMSASPIKNIGTVAMDQLDRRGRVVVLGIAAGGGIVVGRFLESGHQDPAFGRGGIVHINAPDGSRPIALATGPGGSILAVIAVRTSGERSGSRFLLVRITPQGDLDPLFGSDGAVCVSPVLHSVDVVAFGPHLEVVLASGDKRSRSTGVLVLARYTRFGTLDESFGRHGIARTDLAVRKGAPAAHAIAFDAMDDVIVAGGIAWHGRDTLFSNRFLARYTTHGRDCSFGVRGITSGSGGDANAIAVSSNDRIVIAGWTGQSPGAGTEFMAARYNGGGAPRTCRGEGTSRR